jgi:hypothetical protein
MRGRDPDSQLPSPSYADRCHSLVSPDHRLSLSSLPSCAVSIPSRKSVAAYPPPLSSAGAQPASIPNGQPLTKMAARATKAPMRMGHRAPSSSCSRLPMTAAQTDDPTLCLLLELHSVAGINSIGIVQIKG